MATTTLAGKLAAASLKVGALATDKTNSQQNYAYISADKILARAGEALAQQGIVIVPSVTSETTERYEGIDKYGKPQARYDAVVCFAMQISDGETSLEYPWVGRGSDYVVPDKALYKAITSGHKYFLMKLLNIGVGNEDGEHDDDGEAATAPKPTQRPQPARAAQRTAPAQNGAQRPAQPATEPVEHASEDAPPLHQWCYDKLDGKCAKFADWSRTKHANSSGPATPAMYQYLAGVIDGITGNTTHKEVLAVLVGRSVNLDNPPGYDLVSQLLDWLPETIGKGEEKQPNPKHEPKYVPCIRAIGELVLQAQGQTSLFG